MLKKENGITIVTLIITIVVMLILAGAIMATSNIVEEANRQRVATSMIMIQTKVKVIKEKADFSGDSSYYIGTRQLSGYYLLDENDLSQMGLEGIIIDDGNYYVNYNTGDVRYINGGTEFAISDFI